MAFLTPISVDPDLTTREDPQSSSTPSVRYSMLLLKALLMSLEPPSSPFSPDVAVKQNTVLETLQVTSPYQTIFADGGRRRFFTGRTRNRTDVRKGRIN